MAPSRIQGLRREYESLTELRKLGEKLEEKEVVLKLLESMPLRCDSSTIGLEQFGDTGSMTSEETVESAKVHEMRFLKEIPGKKSKNSSLRLSVTPRNAILVKHLLQEKVVVTKEEVELVVEEEIQRM